jgi:hypothetical protein
VNRAEARRRFVETGKRNLLRRNMARDVALYQWETFRRRVEFAASLQPGEVACVECRMRHARHGHVLCNVCGFQTAGTLSIEEG